MTTHDEVRALTQSTGTAIYAILPHTFKLFAPHLLANKDAIKSVSGTEVEYGPHPRQKLDIYRSPTETSTSPILVSLYGGGLVRGDKQSPNSPENLVYHNLGTFFAKRGITTIIPNYRRVNSPSGGDDAVFPSGGEDVSLVLKWLEGFVSKGKRDVYLLGNSAGGVHVTTFLLEPRFLDQRKKYTSGETSITLKGFIGLAVPLHFKSALPGRSDPLQKYYGDGKDVSEKCAYGLLEAVAKTGKSRAEIGVPKALALLGEYDPQDEIGEPMKDFVALWEKTWGGDSITFETIAGHNHISPPLSLMSGDTKLEKWGEDVLAWIQASSK